MEGLIVDLFAGGGGASQGIEAALGRPVDIALNHDAVALAVHRANHPSTYHVEEDVWKANPTDLVQGRPVALLWASPDCTHHSIAKGGKPRKKKLRTLAWAVYRWARSVRPAVIFIENVKEFEGWGPLTKAGLPDKRFLGKTFRLWVRRIEGLGYRVEHRMLDASLYGAPTSRRRLFIVARSDGRPIVWPAETHGPGRLAVRTAGECIDFARPCQSIFERKRPLAKKTEWRIAQGIKRFVLDNPRPFIVKFQQNSVGQSIDSPLHTVMAGAPRFGLVTPVLDRQFSRSAGARADAPMPVITTRTKTALIAPTLVQVGYVERPGQAARVPGLDKPLGTVVAQGKKHALVAAFLAKHYGGVVGTQMEMPLGTITTRDHHAVAAASLVKLRGQCHGPGIPDEVLQHGPGRAAARHSPSHGHHQAPDGPCRR